jgi:hypothetical protein
MANKAKNLLNSTRRLLLGLTLTVLLLTTGLLGGLNGHAQAATDVYVIDENNVTFNPTRSNAPKFKSQDLVVTVSDTRISNGATCDIKARVWPTPSAPNPAFTSTMLTNVNTAYNGSCTATLPTANQSTYLWEFQIRITSGGQTYGVDTSYFFLFGAAIVVDVTATNVPNS